MTKPTKLVQCMAPRFGRLGGRCTAVVPIQDARLLLDGPLGHMHAHYICQWHFDVLDRVNRIRFWRRRREPDIGTMYIEGDSDTYAAYFQNDNVIRLSQNFFGLTTEQQVTTLAHETIHWVLGREFGLLTSMGFDLLYRRPLRCLGGHSLHTLMLDSLYAQTEGELAGTQQASERVTKV